MAKMIKKKWLAELLADKQAVELLLEFLKNTQIKNKKGKAENEKE